MKSIIKENRALNEEIKEMESQMRGSQLEIMELKNVKVHGALVKNHVTFNRHYSRNIPDMISQQEEKPQWTDYK